MKKHFAAGSDGCRSGWVVVRKDLLCGTTSLDTFQTFRCSPERQITHQFRDGTKPDRRINPYSKRIVRAMKTTWRVPGKRTL